MNNFRRLAVAGLIGLALSACGGGPTVTGGTVSLSAEQVASAMDNDRFFADYGPLTMVMSGSVKSVLRGSGDTVIQFTTRDQTNIFCDIGSQAVSLGTGASVSVVAKASAVRRQPNGIMIRPCGIAG